MHHHLLGEPGKGMASRQKLNEDDAQRPVVPTLLAEDAAEGLRRRIMCRPTCRGGMHRPLDNRCDAEVDQRQLQRLARGDQNILGLEVAMLDVLAVQLGQAQGQFTQYCFNDGHGKPRPVSGDHVA